MKKWVIFIGIVGVLILGGYFSLSFIAVKLIQPHLQKAMGSGFNLNEIKVKLTYLCARGVQYEDPDSGQRLLQSEEVRFYPAFLSLFRKSLHLKEIVMFQPAFFFYRSQEGMFIGPWVKANIGRVGEENSGKEEKRRGESVSIRIDRIRAQKGSMDFEDRKAGEPPAHLRFRELNFEMREVEYPFISLHSPIELKGKMEGRKQEGEISIKGWIDLKTADLETSLKIQEIEIETFKPYYRKRVTAEIDSGTLDMESKIILKGRRIDTHGRFDFVNLRIQEGKGTVFRIPSETLAPLLKKSRRFKVPFHVEGNLEDPKFHLHEAFLARIAFSFAEAIGLPIKSVGGSSSEDSGRGTEGVGPMEELWKKKKEKKRKFP